MTTFFGKPLLTLMSLLLMLSLAVPAVTLTGCRDDTEVVEDEGIVEDEGVFEDDEGIITDDRDVMEDEGVFEDEGVIEENTWEGDDLGD